MKRPSVIRAASEPGRAAGSLITPRGTSGHQDTRSVAQALPQLGDWASPRSRVGLSFLSYVTDRGLPNFPKAAWVPGWPPDELGRAARPVGQGEAARQEPC